MAGEQNKDAMVKLKSLYTTGDLQSTSYVKRSRFKGVVGRSTVIDQPAPPLVFVQCPLTEIGLGYEEEEPTHQTNRRACKKAYVVPDWLAAMR